MASIKQIVRESPGDRLFLGFIYLVLTIILVITLYPLIFIVSSSLSSPSAVAGGRVWLWPVEPTLIGYKSAFLSSQLVTGFANSLFYTVCGTAISVILTVMLSYPISRKTFFGRSVVMMLVVFTLLFTGGLIPTYMVVRGVGLIDTRWALLLPNAIWVWQVIIARTFFATSIPDELADAAEIDGCSDIRFVWSIVLPLSKAILAVLALTYAVGQWNAYFDALIYLKSVKLFPLQLFLRSFLILNSNTGTIDAGQVADKQQLLSLMKYSIIVISSLPVLIIFPFVQRYFVQGLLIGSVKG